MPDFLARYGGSAGRAGGGGAGMNEDLMVIGRIRECPFCGGYPYFRSFIKSPDRYLSWLEMRHLKGRFKEKQIIGEVGCPNCGVVLRTNMLRLFRPGACMKKVIIENRNKAVREAIEQWNKRIGCRECKRVWRNIEQDANEIRKFHKKEDEKRMLEMRLRRQQTNILYKLEQRIGKENVKDLCVRLYEFTHPNKVMATA